MKLIKGEIISNKKIGEDLFKMTIFSPYIIKNSIPGQFVNIKCSSSNTIDPLLRRPFSIHDVEPDFKVFSILFVLKGTGTDFLSKLCAGDILDFAGPLGNGIDTTENEDKKFLLIGGGIGVAPLYFLAKRLVSEGKEVFFAAGFKNNNFLLFEKMLQGLKISYEIYSEDGMHGKKGLITDLLYERIDEFKKHEAICCGPVQMYKVLQNVFSFKNINAKALFEEIMACGIGVCKGCAMKFKNGKDGFEYRTVCKDGPVFNLMEAIFD
ncbi:MAG: dihydroorotate dehydrogenase electron transfer subunit [Candidatus Humimicrobiaceae bacterium]